MNPSSKSLDPHAAIQLFLRIQKRKKAEISDLSRLIIYYQKANQPSIKNIIIYFQ